MPRKRNNPVILTGEDRGTLEGLIAGGHAPARRLTHARILLKADEGYGCSQRGLARCEDSRGAGGRPLDARSGAREVRRGGPGGRPRPHRKPKNTKPEKLDGSREAHSIALACSEPPRGKKRWGVRLLAERFVRLECAEEPISRELVGRTLKKVP
jgi:hypothetical protein